MANYTKEEQLELINSGFSGWLNLEKIDNQYEEVSPVPFLRDK